MQALIPFPQISPEIFSLDLGFFVFSLRWYALAYIVGILIGWRITLQLLRNEALWPGREAPANGEQLEALMTWIILGVVIGGRLGFVLFYQPGYYLQNPGEVLMVWQGGMSFHGGMLGVIAGIVIFCWRQGIPLLGMTDAVSVGVPPALLLGRIANFINGELWGRPTDLPWGVVFPGEMAQNCPGVVGPCARHPSQLYEAGMEGLLLGALLLALAYRGGLRWRGYLTGVFLTGYGLARFIVEFARQADAQFITPDNPMGNVIEFGATGTGLSMGQLLSLPMIAVGLGLIAYAMRARARTR